MTQHGDHVALGFMYGTDWLITTYYLSFILLSADDLVGINSNGSQVVLLASQAMTYDK